MVCGFRKYLLNGFGSTGDFEIEKPSKCLEMLNKRLDGHRWLGWRNESKIGQKRFFFEEMRVSEVTGGFWLL